MNLARVRKAIAAALGLAATLIVLVPEETVPERWRPWAGLILAVATVAGVYRVKNAQPVSSRQQAADRVFGPRRHPPTPPE
jgi:hypothetical protein